jgi:hypothetical protein
MLTQKAAVQKNSTKHMTTAFCVLLHSSVSIVTRHGLNNRSSIPGRDNFSIHSKVNTGSGPQKAACPRRGGVFLEMNRPRRENNHSPPPSAKVKNEWSYTSTSVCLHGTVLKESANENSSFNVSLKITSDGSYGTENTTYSPLRQNLAYLDELRSQWVTFKNPG